MLLGHPQTPLVDFKEEPQPFSQRIDPSLLQFSTGSAAQTSSSTTSTEADKTPNQAASANNANFSIPMSLKRAGAPPRLELDFMTYRNALRDVDITPDSPLVGIDWDQGANPSPTRSDGESSSGGSQLSAFAVPPLMSAASSVSPASSTLQTPVDELSSGTNEIDVMMKKAGQVKTETVEIELSDGMKEVL
jgi:hypothetical protein